MKYLTFFIQHDFGIFDVNALYIHFYRIILYVHGYKQKTIKNDFINEKEEYQN